MNTLYTFEIIFFIISLIISVILLYNISSIISSKGYSTSIGTDPGAFLKFIRIIGKENNKKDKMDYIIILLCAILFSVITFGLGFILFIWNNFGQFFH